jgi:LacI family transcriptional regulator
VQLEEAASSSEGGYHAMKKLLLHKGRFTAVMAFDDMTDFGAIRALTQAGLSAPEQCSVVGYDDVAAAASYNPPITTLNQSTEELGNLGLSSFLHAVQERPHNGRKIDPVQCRVKPVLVIRASTAAVRP